MADRPARTPRTRRFVPLPENRPAVAAGRSLVRALAAGKRPACDLLVLHGPPGVGKSHLVSALVAALARTAPGRSARAVPAAELPPVDDRKALRACDLLAVEDAQHLPPRAAGYLAGLIDHRRGRGRPTVVTAAAGPGELPGLPARLTSRLAGGLVVGLQPLGVASRRALLERLCRLRGLTVDDDALAWLVERTGGGARPLVGAVGRLLALARRQPPPLTLEAVRAFWAAADGESPAGDGPGPVERVLRHVGRAFRVDARRLTARDRGRLALWPRQVGMYLAREVTGLSLARVGASFGGRDHTTVLHACRKVEAAAAADADLANLLRRLRAELA